MSTNDEDELRTLWQSQTATSTPMSPDDLRKRAKIAESSARRSVRLNQTCAGIVVFVTATSLFVLDSGILAKVGTVMLLVGGAYTAWAFPHFFAAISTPVDASAETTAALYKRQLERQRDMNLSARSMGPLLMPAMVLLTLNRHWPDADTYIGPHEWGATVVIVASMFFLMQLVFLYTDTLGHRFQQEIDEFDSNMVRSDHSN